MTRKEEKLQLIYKDESYTIIGACFAVYKDKLLEIGGVMHGVILKWNEKK